jgi:uncharacterized protein YndB with AHSA1/START domain
MSKQFEIKREVVLTGTPDDVWEAVATTAGNSSWLFPNEIAPDGSGASVWDPPNHFEARMEQGEWFNALDFQIQAKDGSHTTLRYMHSGIFMDDWDNQFDGADQHTDFYLHTLGQYLAHFNGRTSTYIGDAPAGILGPVSSATPDGFVRLQELLGLSTDAVVDDQVLLTPAGMDPINGVLDYRTDNFIGVRTDDALYRFFGRNAFGAPVGLSIHDFSQHPDAEATKQRWHEWLEASFPA